MPGNRYIRALGDRKARQRLTRLATGRARGVLHGHRGVRFGRGVVLTGDGEYLLHRGSTIHDDCRLYVAAGATLEVLPGASIGARSVVNVATRVVIGEGSQISWQCQILDTDFHTFTASSGVDRPTTAPVVIGARVLVGTGALILKGVTLGDGSVVGAGAVVTRDVAEHVVVAGNPAQPVASVRDWR